MANGVLGFQDRQASGGVGEGPGVRGTVSVPTLTNPVALSLIVFLPLGVKKKKKVLVLRSPQFQDLRDETNLEHVSVMHISPLIRAWSFLTILSSSAPSLAEFCGVLFLSP